MIAMTLWPNSWPFVFSQAPPPFLWFSWQSPDVRTAPEMSEFWSDCVAKPAPGEEEQRAWQFLHSKRSGWSEVGTVRIAENRNCLCLFGKKYRLCLGCRTVLLLREPKEFWLQKMCKLSSKEISSSPASLRRFTWQRSANYIAHHSTVDVYSVYSGCGFDLFGEHIWTNYEHAIPGCLVVLALQSWSCHLVFSLAVSRCVSLRLVCFIKASSERRTRPLLRKLLAAFQASSKCRRERHNLDHFATEFSDFLCCSW